MLDLIADILSKPEVKKELEAFYAGNRFFLIQTAYFSIVCIYMFMRGYWLLEHGAHPYSTTFFTLLLASIVVKTFLVYKRQVYTVYPSILLYMFSTETNQLIGLLIFFLNPIFYMIIIRQMSCSTFFIMNEYKNAHLTVMLLYFLPLILEVLMFIFLMIIFVSADVIANKTVITKDMEQKFEKESVDCLICKCEFEEDEILTTLKCSHKFHDDCIVTWFKFNNACPLCKQTLLQQGSLREIVSKVYL